jgi:hypothetical protein
MHDLSWIFAILFYLLLQVLSKSQKVSHTVPFHIARGLNNGSKYMAPPGLNTLNIEHLLKHGKINTAEKRLRMRQPYL